MSVLVNQYIMKCDRKSGCDSVIEINQVGDDYKKQRIGWISVGGFLPSGEYHNVDLCPSCVEETGIIEASNS